MHEIAVVHMDLMAKGGGEAVAMNTIEALQTDHDVTLLTLTDPDLSALNDYFNTAVDVSDLTVQRAGWLAVSTVPRKQRGCDQRHVLREGISDE